MKFNLSPLAKTYNEFLINGLKSNKLMILLLSSISFIGYINLPYLEKRLKKNKILENKKNN